MTWSNEVLLYVMLRRPYAELSLLTGPCMLGVCQPSVVGISLKGAPPCSVSSKRPTASLPGRHRPADIFMRYSREPCAHHPFSELMHRLPSWGLAVTDGLLVTHKATGCELCTFQMIMSRA